MDRSKIKREKLRGASGGFRLCRRLLGTGPADGVRIVGSIATPVGMVAVHSEYNNHDRYTIYRFAFRGYEHRYVEKAYHEAQTLATKAHRFAKEVVKMMEGKNG